MKGTRILRKRRPTCCSRISTAVKCRSSNQVLRHPTRSRRHARIAPPKSTLRPSAQLRIWRWLPGNAGSSPAMRCRLRRRCSVPRPGTGRSISATSRWASSCCTTRRCAHCRPTRTVVPLSLTRLCAVASPRGKRSRPPSRRTCAPRAGSIGARCANAKFARPSGSALSRVR